MARIKGNNLVTVDYDKFSDVSFVTPKEYIILWQGQFPQTMYLNLSLVCNCCGESRKIYLYLDYMEREWMFFRNGRITILADGQRFVAQAQEVNTEAVYAQWVKERTRYEITPDFLKVMGDAKHIEVQITAGRAKQENQVDMLGRMSKLIYKTCIDTSPDPDYDTKLREEINKERIRERQEIESLKRKEPMESIGYTLFGVLLLAMIIGTVIAFYIVITDP